MFARVGIWLIAFNSCSCNWTHSTKTKSDQNKTKKRSSAKCWKAITLLIL